MPKYSNLPLGHFAFQHAPTLLANHPDSVDGHSNGVPKDSCGARTAPSTRAPDCRRIRRSSCSGCRCSCVERTRNLLFSSVQLRRHRQPARLQLRMRGIVRVHVLWLVVLLSLHLHLLLLTLLEWYEITWRGQHSLQFSVACLVALVCSAVALTGHSVLNAAVLVVVASTVLAFVHRSLAWPAVGTIYCSFVLLAMLALRADAEHGLVAVLFVVFVVWGTDSFAYLAGRSLGGPPLSPMISPNKTWSGALGGVVGGVGVGISGAEHLHSERRMMKRLMNSDTSC